MNKSVFDFFLYCKWNIQKQFEAYDVRVLWFLEANKIRNGMGLCILLEKRNYVIIS